MDLALAFLVACLVMAILLVVVIPLRAWRKERRERRRRLMRYLLPDGTESYLDDFRD